MGGVVVPSDEGRWPALMAFTNNWNTGSGTFNCRNLTAQLAVVTQIDLVDTAPVVGDGFQVDVFVPFSGSYPLFATTVGTGHDSFHDQWTGELPLLFNRLLRCYVLSGGTWSVVVHGYFTNQYPSTHGLSNS